MAVEDMDLDGRLDLIVPGGVLLNQGAGVFSQSAFLPEVGAVKLAVGDLDGDGLKDVVTGHSSYVTVALGVAGGLLGEPRHYAVNGTDGIEVVDVNGDGRLDLLSVSRARSVFSVVFNTDPTLIRFRTDKVRLSWPVLVGVPSFNVYRGSLADLSDGDGDGVPDTGYGACRNQDDPDLGDTVFIDDEDPLSGEGFYYLMARVNGDQQETDLGTATGGQPRVPGLPCAPRSR